MNPELFPWAPGQPNEEEFEPCIMIDALKLVTGEYFSDGYCNTGLSYACIIPF